MEIDFCQLFYEKFPPKELVEDLFSLIEETQNAFISTFKDVINKLKNNNSITTDNSIEHSEKIIDAEISLNKNVEQKSFLDLNLLLGNCFYFPYEEHLPYKDLEDRFVLLFEVPFENENKAQETLDKINKNFMPFLHTFPYYISFNKYGGDFICFRHENLIMVCLTRVTQTSLSFKKLLHDCQFYHNNPGLNIHINISSAFNIFKLSKEINQNDFLNEISSIIIKLNFKLTQPKFVIKRLLQILEENEYETEQQKLFFKKIIYRLKIHLYINDAKINLDLEPTVDTVKSLLLTHCFGAECFLDDYIDKKLKEKEMYEFLVQMVIKLSKKFDIDITEDQMFAVKMNYIDKLNRLLLKTCLGKRNDA